MPLVIFWLVPVVLVVVLLLVLLSNKPKNKPKLFLVEPLLFLFDSWQLARVEGDEKITKKLLEYWLPGLEMQHSTVEQLVKQIKTSPPLLSNKRINIINQHKLDFWSEEREIELNGRKTFVLVGPVSEVLQYCSVDNSGELTSERKDNLEKEISKAYKHGFFVLAVASGGSDNALGSRRYRLTGLAFLEPAINDKARAKLHQMNAQGSIRFLSLLPADFVESLVKKVFPNRKDNVITGSELKELSPKEQDRTVKEKTIFAEIAKNNRYYTVKHLGIENELIVVSRISSDQELPADKKI